LIRVLSECDGQYADRKQEKNEFRHHEFHHSASLSILGDCDPKQVGLRETVAQTVQFAPRLLDHCRKLRKPDSSHVPFNRLVEEAAQAGPLCATFPNHLHKRQITRRVQKIVNLRGCYIAMAWM
jgi:hypothetical protein